MAAKKMTGGKTPPKRTDTAGRSGMGASERRIPIISGPRQGERVKESDVKSLFPKATGNIVGLRSKGTAKGAAGSGGVKITYQPVYGSSVAKKTAAKKPASSIKKK